MQYFLDKLKEFLVFLVFSRLVQGVVGTHKSNQEGHSKVKRKFKFSSWLLHTCCETLHRSAGGENDSEWEEDSSEGRLIGHCVSPPTVETDRRACEPWTRSRLAMRWCIWYRMYVSSLPSSYIVSHEHVATNLFPYLLHSVTAALCGQFAYHRSHLALTASQHHFVEYKCDS